MKNKFEYKGNNPEILSKTKILIVDDSKIQRLILSQMFKNYGFLNIFEAENGKEGLDKTKEIFPDLVLLDINMPVMNGFEYCQKIRSDDTLKHIAILVQTGNEDPKTKAKIFEVGADDHITKPIDYPEIAARSFVHLERQIMLKELEEYKRRIDEEMEAAQNLQTISMPSKKEIESTSEKYNININSLLQTSSEMGGDCWGFSDLGDGFLEIYIADFSGHGLNASLNTFRLHTLLKSYDSQEHNKKKPGEYITWLNEKLFKFLPVSQYATMFYGIIDFNKNQLNYTVAACPSAIIMRDYGNEHEFIDGKGFPLAAIKDAKFETFSTKFNKGDSIFLYSDALIETAGKNIPEINEASLSDLLKCYFLDQKSDKIDKSFKNFVQYFMDEYGENICDDLTISMYSRD